MQKIIYLFIALLISFTSSYATETLIIEPDAGRSPILSAIHDAKSSIDLVMYGMTDFSFVESLIQAKKHGKEVNILLEPNPYKSEGENTRAINRFQSADINLKWPNPKFKLTHQKTFVIDHHEAIIMTFNLTRSTFKDQRNFALITDDPAIVSEIDNVFIADRDHKKGFVKNPNLIWSPDNSREKIMDFIRSANSEIKIYAQDLTDYQTIGALAKAARKGKKVQIITSNFKSTNHKFNFLKNAGVIIHYNKNYVIHAKVIIVDQNRAILGSINLTAPSLNDNRELSIITRDPETVKKLLQTFNQDW